MNANDAFERELADRLADAADQGTDARLDLILTTTSRTRRTATWLALLKEPPMRSHSSVVVGSPTMRLVTILMLTVALITALGAATIGASSVLLPSPKPLAPPFGPAANGPMAYALAGDIHLVDADGTHDRVIIDDPAADVGPWFSKDGGRLFFVRDPDSSPRLMVSNPDGSDVRQVMDPAPDWFEDVPDGHSIVAAVGDPAVLRIVDIDTGTVVRDIDLGGPEPTGWVVARPPRGDELILTAYVVPGQPDIAFYGFDLATGQVRQIGAPTTGESKRGDPPPDASHMQWSLQDPSLSPDGSTIAFWNWETPPRGVLSSGYPHARDLDSGAEVPLPFLKNGAGTILVTYAPDGQSVAYRRTTSAEHIVVDRVDGGDPQPVGGFFDYQSSQGFDFSPDSTRILHTTTDPGRTTIYDLDDDSEIHLDGVTERPSWQRLAP